MYQNLPWMLENGRAFIWGGIYRICQLGNAATIYFITQFSTASIREPRLLNSVDADRTEDEEIHCLKEGGVAADARESIQGDTAMLATATATELRNQLGPFVEEDEDELEEKELVLEDC